MANVTIRDLDDDLEKRLRIRAAQHGHSMEEEAREILRTVLIEEAQTPHDLGKSIHRRFSVLGGVKLEDAPRDVLRDPPTSLGSSEDGRTSSTPR